MYHISSTSFVKCAFLVVSLILCACTANTDYRQDESDVISTLNNFLHAFENGNFEMMEASFSEDAYIFPRAIMSNDYTQSIDNNKYRRMNGMDPQMKQLIVRLRESGKEPPYLKLEPKDLKVTMFNDAALVTFHLENGNSLSRRTIVLGKEDGSWKIIHIHPSNVVSTDKG